MRTDPEPTLSPTRAGRPTGLRIRAVPDGGDALAATRVEPWTTPAPPPQASRHRHDRPRAAADRPARHPRRDEGPRPPAPQRHRPAHRRRGRRPRPPPRRRRDHRARRAGRRRSSSAAPASCSTSAPGSSCPRRAPTTSRSASTSAAARSPSPGSASSPSSARSATGPAPSGSRGRSRSWRRSWCCSCTARSGRLAARGYGYGCAARHGYRPATEHDLVRDRPGCDPRRYGPPLASRRLRPGAAARATPASADPILFFFTARADRAGRGGPRRRRPGRVPPSPAAPTRHSPSASSRPCWSSAPSGAARVG